MFIIGLTGGIASGKSTVSAILGKQGCLIIDADEIHHENLESGNPAYREILTAFGMGILGADGEIDRKKLGAIVFGNREKLSLLNELSHKFVLAKIDEILTTEARGYKFAVIDAALLIEAGADSLCDTVWLVTAPVEERARRLELRGGLSRGEALLRIESRMPDAELTLKCSEVIENNGTLSELKNKVMELLCRLS